MSNEIGIRVKEASKICDWLEEAGLQDSHFYRTAEHARDRSGYELISHTKLEWLVHDMEKGSPFPRPTDGVVDNLFNLATRKLSDIGDYHLSAFRSYGEDDNYHIVWFTDKNEIYVKKANEFTKNLEEGLEYVEFQDSKEKDLVAQWIKQLSPSAEPFQKNLVTGTVFEYGGTVYEITDHKYHQWGVIDGGDVYNHKVHKFSCIPLLPNDPSGESEEFFAREVYEKGLIISQPHDIKQRTIDKNKLRNTVPDDIPVIAKSYGEQPPI